MAIEHPLPCKKTVQVPQNKVLHDVVLQKEEVDKGVDVDREDVGRVMIQQHCKPKTPLHYPYTREWTECKGGLREIWRV